MSATAAMSAAAAEIGPEEQDEGCGECEQHAAHDPAFRKIPESFEHFVVTSWFGSAARLRAAHDSDRDPVSQAPEQTFRSGPVGGAFAAMLEHLLADVVAC